MACMSLSALLQYLVRISTRTRFAIHTFNRNFVPCFPLSPLCDPALSLHPTRRPTPHSLRIRLLEVMRRDPTLIISLGAARDGWPVRARDRYLIRRIDLLEAARGGAGARTIFAAGATLPLGKEGREPGGVDEVGGAGEGGCEDEVEEDAVGERDGLVE